MLDQHLTENFDCFASIETKKKLDRRLLSKSRLKKYHLQHQQLLFRFKKSSRLLYIMADNRPGTGLADKQLSTSSELEHNNNNNNGNGVLTAINLALATGGCPSTSTSTSNTSSAASTSSSNEFHNYPQLARSFTDNNNPEQNVKVTEIRQQPVEFDDDYEEEEENEEDIIHEQDPEPEPDRERDGRENQESNDNYDDIDETENERIRSSQLSSSNLQSMATTTELESTTQEQVLVEDESSGPGYAASRYSRLTARLRSYLNAASNTSNVPTPHESLISKFGLNVNLSSIRRHASHRSASNETFQPRSTLFTKIHNDYKQIRTANVKPNKLSELLKLANLYLNYEGYYSLMLLPMSDNFQLSLETVENTTQDCNTGCVSTSFKRMKHRSSSEHVDDKDVVDDDDDEMKEESEESDTRNKSGSTGEELQQTWHKSEFHLCGLCLHALYEPVTLVCGCTYCKNCLNEYNQALKSLDERKRKLVDEESSLEATGRQSSESSGGEDASSTSAAARPKHKSNTTTKRKHHSQTSLSMSYRCFNCSKTHEQNTTEYQKTNVLITKLVEKFWSSNVEMRKLRNDIRNYICFCMEKHQSSDSHFDLNKFEYMLNSAYTLDPSNHLILADLFILNYFNQCDQTCLKYAQMACDLKPNWTFGYYMKSIYYEQIGDTNNIKSNLITCLQLEPNIEQIRIKLYQIFAQSNSPFNTVTDSGSFNNTSSLNNQFKKKLAEVLDVNTRKPFHFNKPDSIKLSEIKFDKTNETQLSEQQQSTLTFDLCKYIVINSQLVKPAELECSLCMRLFYNPVTTPCGHSFCAVCLERSLDHQDRCPLCKNSLADYLAERRQHTTNFLDKLIRTYYGNDYAERKKQHQEELRELLGDENEIPVFVCTLALPFAPCPLHIYEPRYRLMLRRAIQTGRKQFGMCMYSERTPYHYTEYGCMLEIQTYQFTPDGRSIVTTVGGRRFRVLKSGTKDGYNVAKVEWVKDVRIEDEQEKTELIQLHDEVYRLAQAWYSVIPDTQKNRIMEIYGIAELPMPEADIQTENGPYWHWFLLNILPLETDFQYKFLTKTSLKERLKQMKKILLVLTAPFKDMLVAQLQGTGSTSNSSTRHARPSSEPQTSSVNTQNDSSSLNSSETHPTPSDALSSASSNEISINSEDNGPISTATTASQLNLNNNPYI